MVEIGNHERPLRVAVIGAGPAGFYAAQALLKQRIVAKQIGCTLSHDEEHHLFSGMLVEDAHDWPEDDQVIACEGDVNVLAEVLDLGLFRRVQISHFHDKFVMRVRFAILHIQDGR